MTAPNPMPRRPLRRSSSAFPLRVLRALGLFSLLEGLGLAGIGFWPRVLIVIGVILFAVGASS